MKKFNHLFAIGLITVFAFGCGAKTTESTETVSEEVVVELDVQDIVDLAVGTESLSTLVAALTAADLVSTMQSDGPFTVFAPTNEAFAALPAGTLEMLLKPENKDMLVSILTYHVVSGKVMSTDLSDGMKAATVNGAEVTITTAGGAKVNGANVVAADIVASNGVVHVIDAVILPPSN